EPTKNLCNSEVCSQEIVDASYKALSSLFELHNKAWDALFKNTPSGQTAIEKFFANYFEFEAGYKVCGINREFMVEVSNKSGVLKKNYTLIGDFELNIWCLKYNLAISLIEKSDQSNYIGSELKRLSNNFKMAWGIIKDLQENLPLFSLSRQTDSAEHIKQMNPIYLDFLTNYCRAKVIYLTAMFAISSNLEVEYVVEIVKYFVSFMSNFHISYEGTNTKFKRMKEIMDKLYKISQIASHFVEASIDANKYSNYSAAEKKLSECQLLLKTIDNKFNEPQLSTWIQECNERSVLAPLPYINQNSQPLKLEIKPISLSGYAQSIRKDLIIPNAQLIKLIFSDEMIALQILVMEEKTRLHDRLISNIERTKEIEKFLEKISQSENNFSSFPYILKWIYEITYGGLSEQYKSLVKNLKEFGKNFRLLFDVITTEIKTELSYTKYQSQVEKIRTELRNFESINNFGKMISKVVDRATGIESIQECSSFDNFKNLIGDLVNPEIISEYINKFQAMKDSFKNELNQVQEFFEKNKLTESSLESKDKTEESFRKFSSDKLEMISIKESELSKINDTLCFEQLNNSDSFLYRIYSIFYHSNTVGEAIKCSAGAFEAALPNIRKIINEARNKGRKTTMDNLTQNLSQLSIKIKMVKPFLNSSLLKSDSQKDLSFLELNSNKVSDQIHTYSNASDTQSESQKVIDSISNDPRNQQSLSLANQPFDPVENTKKEIISNQGQSVGEFVSPKFYNENHPVELSSGTGDRSRENLGFGQKNIVNNDKPDFNTQMYSNQIKHENQQQFNPSIVSNYTKNDNEPFYSNNTANQQQLRENSSASMSVLNHPYHSENNRLNSGNNANYNINPTAYNISSKSNNYGQHNDPSAINNSLFKLNVNPTQNSRNIPAFLMNQSNSNLNDGNSQISTKRSESSETQVQNQSSYYVPTYQNKSYQPSQWGSESNILASNNPSIQIRQSQPMQNYYGQTYGQPYGNSNQNVNYQYSKPINQQNNDYTDYQNPGLYYSRNKISNPSAAHNKNKRQSMGYPDNNSYLNQNQMGYYDQNYNQDPQHSKKK
ncbi:MAG: hypothetical protein MHPSP_000764, partial [Paramarteilia canceri]